MDIQINTKINDRTDYPIAKNKPKPTKFDEFLPWACLQYRLDIDVIMSKTTQKSYVKAQTSVHKKLNLKLAQPILNPSESSVSDTSDTSDTYSSSFEKAVKSEENKIIIETIYDINENLVQLKFLKNKIIPRKVIQIIALTIPYQKHLTSITINSGLQTDSLYEISKLLPNSQITELCLDDTFLSKGNYHALLTHGKLKHLSLARCMINDEVVKTIADQLTEPSPAAKVLSALNLSTNRITDIGAKHIAVFLRTNRQLCYLNLAGNMITDEGSASILDTLHKFPVQSRELQESRSRYVSYLKKKNALIRTLMKGMHIAFDKDASKKKSLKKSKLESQSMHYGEIDGESLSIHDRAKYLAEKKLGLFVDAFSPNNTKSQDDVVYCFGNNVLCCLNLAYNNLTYISVKKLLEVLTAQKYLNSTPRGLIKVVIEGNLMPVACKEYEEIDHILGTSSKKQTETATKKKPLPTTRSASAMKY